MTVLFTLLASSLCYTVYLLTLHAFLVMIYHGLQLPTAQDMWINGLIVHIKAVLVWKIMFTGTLWLLSSGSNSKEY